MGETDTEKLLKFKEKIQNAKDDKSRAEGTMQEVLRRLKEEFGVKDLAEAEKRLIELQAEIEGLEKELSEGVKKLEKELSDD